MKKRIATLLLALVLVIGLLPLAAFATEANDVVYISVSYDGQFKTASDGSNLAYVPVELEKLKEIDLDTYNMGDYKYDVDGDGNYEITALHLYIYVQETIMGLKWADVHASGAQGSIYFETGLFGFPDANLNYYYNGAFPVDEKMSAEWGYTVGATADHIVLKSGDCLDVAGFSNDSWMIYSATFRYFTMGDKVIRSASTPKGEALTVKLGSIGRDWSTNEAVLNAEVGATVYYGQTAFAEDSLSVTTDENGEASFTFDKAGKWYIWSMGYNDGSVSCSPAYMEVNVTWKNTSDVTSHWHNFRNSYVNMALTDTKTPVNAETTAMKWAVKLGTGWNANPSVQIIVDDALVVMIGKVLYKMDLQTGEVLQQADMTATPNFGYTPCTYADGLIFCPLSGGTVQAFDAETLESVWIFKDELGGQSLSPITYNDGCIYTGFWNGEKKDANYVCVNVSDGSLVWSKTVTGGFYWAGSVVLGDAVIVGTDDGDSGFAGDSKLYSLNKKDGSVISELTLTGCGDQRSSIAYSEEKGRIYFTAKNGYLCSAKVDVATGEISDLLTSKQADQCTSTPVVYGDQVYFSCGSGVVVGSGGSGNFVVANADTLEQHYVMPLQAYPQGSVLVSEAYLAETGKLYCYSTYNGYPGGLTLIKVDPTVNTADGAELIEIFAPAEVYQQYCITSPICGPDGTIYYKNDSGYVFAVGINNAYLSDLTADIGIFTEGFAASTLSYELVVPVGTETVTLTPTACDGGVSEAITVTLVDGFATAEIVVTKDGDTRTYTVSVRAVSTNADLGSLKVNESNSYGGSVSPDFAADNRYYSYLTAGASRSFVNVWPDAADSHATVKVYPLVNAQGKNDSDILEDGSFKVTATNQGHSRYAIYFVDDTKAMAVRIEVTSENGEVANYYLVISKEAAAEDGTALLEKLKNCDHSDCTVSGQKDATCTEDGYTGDTVCNICGRTEKGEVAEAAGHSYTDGICSVCGEADPNYKTAEGDVEIYITIANKGNVVMFQQKITVVDVNHNGIFDVDDALYAAHEAGYTGGAAAGYATQITQYGLGISKLWGDTSMCYGYWLNNASCWSLEDVVADGNHLVAFVYTDGEFWSDSYSRFDAFDYATTTAQDLVVKLEKAGYDENWNTVFSAHAGATITVYDSEGKALATGYTVTDNGDGSYAIRINVAGNYYIVASDSDPLTVPAVCQVAVTYVEQVPPTGDNSMISLIVATMSVSILAVLCIGKKRVF